MIVFLAKGRTVIGNHHSTLLNHSTRKNFGQKKQKLFQKCLVSVAQFSCTQIAFLHANNSWFGVRITQVPPLFTRSVSVSLSFLILRRFLRDSGIMLVVVGENSLKGMQTCKFLRIELLMTKSDVRLVTLLL